MRCKHFHKILYEFLDGELPAVEAEAARRHLAECAPCAGELARERDLAAKVRAAAIQAAAGLHFRRPVSTRPPLPLRQGGLSFPTWAATAAAVLLLAATLALRLSFPDAGTGPIAAGGAGGKASRATPAAAAPPVVTQVITLEDDLGLVNETHFITEDADGTGTHIVAQLGGGPETENHSLQGGW
ncbi:MAG: zf-HC2 domain-containing protein [Acidobacteria bacterium]|nr:zf-HC2 domain-containing protein [Acidobacteriota bacterium]